MSTGTGTRTDPIIAMSGDPAQIARDVRASLAHFGRTDDAYWIEKEGTPAEFSNRLWHLGHNRYWEARMDPTNTGSADPNLGKLPALWTDAVPSVPVPSVPDPPSGPGPSPATIASITLARLQTIDVALFTLNTKLDGLIDALAEASARLDAIEARTEAVQTQLATLALRPFPSYTGRILGASFTLTPKS